MSSTYAIVSEKSLAMCTVEEHQIELTRGMMVEIVEKNRKDRYKETIIHDFYQKNFVNENIPYLVKSRALIEVPTQMWPFLMAVSDPYERANIARDRPFIEYVLSLEEGRYVTVIGDYFNHVGVNQAISFLPEREPKGRILDYECMVRYVGPIEELAPGYMFGLELLVNLRKKTFFAFRSSRLAPLTVKL